MSKRTRLVARVTGKLPEPKVKHYWGMPKELTDGVDTRILMDWPSILLIEAQPNECLLYRYTSEGACVGDTWHQNLDDAKHQATYEFPNLISDWREVPDDVEDAVAFALRK
jgi:hypothetical protein